jgi:TPP-dependent pyruvate/acetoin dehydrogenase alpha subunit
MSSEILIEMYRKMLLIRRFDNFIEEHHLRTPNVKEPHFRGMIHLSIGQEATSVGACLPLRSDDCIVCSYRSHGHVLAKGADPGRVMAEYMGKENGYNSGKAGSLHITIPEVRVLGSYGTVGVPAAIAVGAAYSAKLRGDGGVAVGFFGDGATNAGILYEALNLAAIWQAPAIFFCENNGYAITTPLETVVRNTDLAGRAEPFGVPAVTVDGYDVLAVYEVMKEAVERARRGGGPTFIEAKTYRFVGHLIGDRWNPSYRRPGELERWKARDPLVTFPRLLCETYDLGRNVAEAEREVDNELRRAIDFSTNGQSSDPAHAADGMFSGEEANR